MIIERDIILGSQIVGRYTQDPQTYEQIALVYFPTRNIEITSKLKDGRELYLENAGEQLVYHHVRDKETNFIVGLLPNVIVDNYSSQGFYSKEVYLHGNKEQEPFLWIVLEQKQI